MIRALCLAAVLLVALAGPAAAHDVTAGADLRLAQTIGGAEVTLVIKGTPRVPGPLRIGVVAFERAAGLPVRLEVRSLAGGGTATAVARAAAEPEYAEVRVTEPGPHELTVRAGGEVSVVPFRVLVGRGSAGDFLIYGGFFVAGSLLVGGLLTGAVSRRGPAMLLAAGAAAGVTVAAMVVVLEPLVPPGPPDGAAPTGTRPAGGRPYAQSRIATAPARPVAGDEFTLRLDLTDGSTGRPVDDLVSHHEALAHLIVTSEDGRYFRHVHPLRTAPGRLEVRLRTDRPGRYLAYAELERQDSGGQLLTGEFTIGEDPDPGNRPADGDPATGDPGNRPADGDPVTGGPVEGDRGTAASPRLRPAAPVAGRPATIEVAADGPARPWLGMAGHLIVRSRDGSFLGHVHEMGTPGSRLRFTFTFPRPGRYLAWAQHATTGRIVTTPFTIDVGEQ